MPDVYLNASGQGRPAEHTHGRTIEHLELEARVGPAAARAHVTAEIEAVRETAAVFLGAENGCVGFASTTFETWLNIVSRMQFAGKRLLVAPHEWGDNIRALQRFAAASNGTVEVLPELDLTRPDLSEWADMFDDNVGAVFAPMVTSVEGLRYPIAEIGSLPRASSTLFVVDAAQALGQVKVDVTTLGCDVLVGTARKWLRGPRGTALFWLSEGAIDKNPELSVEAVATLEAHAAMILGLGAALEAYDHDVTLAAIAERSKAVVDIVRHSGFGVLGADTARTGAVSVHMSPEQKAALTGRLAIKEVVIKWPEIAYDEPCSSLAAQGGCVARISPHTYTTDQELEVLNDVFEPIGVS